MSKKIGRGALAALAAGAMALTLGSAASAEVVDADNPIISVPEATVGSAKLHRIADADRILTAVKASKSSNNWGNFNTTFSNWWVCEDTTFAAFHHQPVNLPVGTTRHLLRTLVPPSYVTCTVEVNPNSIKTTGKIDIIVARADDYPDALAAAPLADVLDAPVLLHPNDLIDNDSRPGYTDLGLHPAVKAEIERLANIGVQNKTQVTVHLLGATQALSHAVENAIDDISGVDVTLRHQGTNRFQTATSIAGVTANWYRVDSGATTPDINVYLTTGLDFPDALSAGAAAAENDGVVILTNGTGWDRDGFSRDFLSARNTWINDGWFNRNTSEVFAVGGPSAAAAAGADGTTVAASYVGATRFETAAITAQATFNNPKNFAIVSGITFPDALVGGAFIANADGPLLLTNNDSLHPATADYLSDNGEGYDPVVPNVNSGDNVIVFGGGNSVSQNVSAQVKALLETLFAQPNW